MAKKIIMSKNKEDLCKSCTKREKCNFKKRVNVDKIIACVDYEEDKWCILAKEEKNKKMVKENG